MEADEKSYSHTELIIWLFIVGYLFIYSQFILKCGTEQILIAHVILSMWIILQYF